MGMTITKYEKTVIPQTQEGIIFAHDYENRIREQGCFISRKEDTQCIIITAQYHYTISEVEDGNDNRDR